MPSCATRQQRTKALACLAASPRLLRLRRGCISTPVPTHGERQKKDCAPGNKAHLSAGVDESAERAPVDLALKEQHRVLAAAAAAPHPGRRPRRLGLRRRCRRRRGVFGGRPDSLCVGLRQLSGRRKQEVGTNARIRTTRRYVQRGVAQPRLVGDFFLRRHKNLSPACLRIARDSAGGSVI